MKEHDVDPKAPDFIWNKNRLVLEKELMKQQMMKMTEKYTDGKKLKYRSVDVSPNGKKALILRNFICYTGGICFLSLLESQINELWKRAWYWLTQCFIPYQGLIVGAFLTTIFGILIVFKSKTSRGP